jgi:hypothetical protein
MRDLNCGTLFLNPLMPVSLGLALVTCSNTTPLQTSRRSTFGILGGQPSQRSGVVAVDGPDEGCSAYLITANLVLTARHCVGPISGQGSATTAGAPYSANRFVVYTDAALVSGVRSEAVAEVFVLPDSTGKPLWSADLALLRLERVQSGKSLIEPRVDLPPHVAEVFTAVGYGQNGSEPSTAGVRRELSGAKVATVGSGTYPNGTLRRTDGEWSADKGPCYGDSGSPAIDAAGRSMGVMSRGEGALCTDMTYERVDVHADWIRDRVRITAEQHSLPVPEWVIPPAQGSAQFGDDCRGAKQCLTPFECLPVGERFRCTTFDCSKCSGAWKCGPLLEGQGCIPDPTWKPDARAPDALLASGDSGDSGDSGAQGSGSGCTAAPSCPDWTSTELWLIASAALLVTLRRSRRN